MLILSQRRRESQFDLGITTRLGADRRQARNNLRLDQDDRRQDRNGPGKIKPILDRVGTILDQIKAIEDRIGTILARSSRSLTGSGAILNKIKVIQDRSGTILARIKPIRNGFAAIAIAIWSDLNLDQKALNRIAPNGSPLRTSANTLRPLRFKFLSR